MDDSQAIRQMKRGDIGALESLVRRYQLKAARVAFLITQDEALAQDLIQDVFLRMFHAAHRIDERQSFEAYLMRSVVNAALNALRHQRNFMPLDEDTAEVERLMQQAASVESQVELAELKRAILAALGRLSPRQRAVIVQRYYLEMSEEEMATSLHLSRGTVKWLLHGARQRLRALLGKERSAE